MGKGSTAAMGAATCERQLHLMIPKFLRTGGSRLADVRGTALANALWPGGLECSGRRVRVHCRARIRDGDNSLMWIPAAWRVYRYRSVLAKKQLFCALLPNLSSAELAIVSFGKSFEQWERKQSSSKSRLSSRMKDKKDNDSDKARSSFTAGLLAIILGTLDQT